MGRSSRRRKHKRYRRIIEASQYIVQLQEYDPYRAEEECSFLYKNWVNEIWRAANNFDVLSWSLTTLGYAMELGIKEDLEREATKAIQQRLMKPHPRGRIKCSAVRISP